MQISLVRTVSGNYLEFLFVCNKLQKTMLYSEYDYIVVSQVVNVF